MTSIEQRLNLWHLAAQPLLAGVPGDLVELGCFQGATATIFGTAIQRYAPDRHLHLYDHFGVEFHLSGQDIEGKVTANFRAAALPAPIIHRGDFAATVPKELPDQIAFAHIDCGCGGDPDAHRRTVVFLLQHVYPRMPSGAVCVLMDYHDPERCAGPDYNPGVRRGVQEFLTDKMDRVGSLWGGEYAHGCFRKR
jgi:O-methyltransferase